MICPSWLTSSRPMMPVLAHEAPLASRLLLPRPISITEAGNMRRFSITIIHISTPSSQLHFADTILAYRGRCVLLLFRRQLFLGYHRRHMSLSRHFLYSHHLFLHDADSSLAFTHTVMPKFDMVVNQDRR